MFYVSVSEFVSDSVVVWFPFNIKLIAPKKARCKCTSQTEVKRKTSESVSFSVRAPVFVLEGNRYQCADPPLDLLKDSTEHA